VGYYLVLSYRKFKEVFPELKKGDLIGIRLPFKKGEERLIVDLMARGVEAFPSFLSQMLSQSKVMQAEVFRDLMPPCTFAIYDKTSLLGAISRFSKAGFKDNPVITKEDKANCGLGIKFWNSLEEVFNFAGTSALPFPFVMQPFFKSLRDIRVIWLGELYVEAYERKNSYNFRQNLFFGGSSLPYELSEEEKSFCKRVLKRGGFPYAHIDMVYVEGKGPFLGEVNLKGGIKGAKISTKDYEALIKKINEDFFKYWESLYSPLIPLTP